MSKLSSVESRQILEILANRFTQNMNRHRNVDWEIVREQLIANPDKLWSVNQMELTGGEPDVVSSDNQIKFFDCAAESPLPRRSTCYDFDARTSRKANAPKSSAQEMALQMNVELLTETDYRLLQQLGNFDLKTSSWLKTPDNIRKLGGAIFADQRYGHVFIYHNGVQSYYASRGWRGKLEM
ncbi:MAG: DUF4256 domain-containing protein [Flavobacterium sp.]|nr:DUF4256 domain-containing protein [Flavobacterium sp.]